jgi:hypothetical protein
MLLTNFDVALWMKTFLTIWTIAIHHLDGAKYDVIRNPSVISRTPTSFLFFIQILSCFHGREWKVDTTVLEHLGLARLFCLAQGHIHGKEWAFQEEYLYFFQRNVTFSITSFELF